MSEYARRERAALRHARELARQAKERAKLDEKANARFEVESHENQIQILLSLHKEVGETWDWQKIAASLPPLAPLDSTRFEMRTRQDFLIRPSHGQQNFEDALETAKSRDREVSDTARLAHERRLRQWERMTALARRITERDAKAYIEALGELSPLAELEKLGSNMDFTIHSGTLAECVLTMKDTSVIPSMAKALTATGKLSEKAMPRARFHEIYQDYVCGGILRVARELFAILPIEHALITAVTSVLDSSTGLTADKPVLSVHISRADTRGFNWEEIDPSDAIDRLLHRGNFKASRKSGAFLPVMPLTIDIVATQSYAVAGIEGLLSQVASLRGELKAELAILSER